MTFTSLHLATTGRFYKTRWHFTYYDTRPVCDECWILCRPRTRRLSSSASMTPTLAGLPWSCAQTSENTSVNIMSHNSPGVLRWAGWTGRWRTLTAATCTAVSSRKLLLSSLKSTVLTWRPVDWSRLQSNFLESSVDSRVINIDLSSQDWISTLYIGKYNWLLDHFILSYHSQYKWWIFFIIMTTVEYIQSGREISEDLGHCQFPPSSLAREFADN